VTVSFATRTSRTKTTDCPVCGRAVLHEELRILGRRGEASHWQPVAHRAPCGAHCGGGGYDFGETDVHILAFGSCPRCGATETEVAKVIEKPDGSERVVFQRYTVEYRKDLGFRIELEVQEDSQWKVKSRWPTNDPDSLDKTIEWAKRYVPWLQGVAYQRLKLTGAAMLVLSFNAEVVE
jgi:hypothetical protein